MKKHHVVVLIFSVYVTIAVYYGVSRIADESVKDVYAPQIVSSADVKGKVPYKEVPRIVTGFPTEEPVVCTTLGGKLVLNSNDKGYIGCDVIVTGNFDLSKSYCEADYSKSQRRLIPDAFGRRNRYYATLSGVSKDEPATVYVYTVAGQKVECTPKLNK